MSAVIGARVLLASRISEREISLAVLRGRMERHHDRGDPRRYRAGMLFVGVSLLCW